MRGHLSESGGMSRTLPLVASLSLFGCAVNDDTTSVSSAIVTAPGGWSLNGPDLNGVNSAATGGTDVMLTGVLPTGRSASGSVITINPTGAALSGRGFVGSRWVGALSNGRTVPLTITAASQATGRNADVWWYTFYATVGNHQVPLCTDPDGHPIGADTVRGTWNVGQGVPGGGAYHPQTANFTVACADSAIAKCLELGYKPWTGHGAEAAACVRAMRGDFCGDGAPYTVTGTQIGIFDDAGLQADDGWEVEAAWTADGAACIVEKSATRFDRFLHETPSCIGRSVKINPSCDMDFRPTVKIVTELPPQ
jgi:hypothetical protein